MRIEVVGGGPAGLYAARLLRLRHPEWRVRVHERNHPDATFGFGIGLSPNTLRRMQAADPESHAAILRQGWPLDTWRFRIAGKEIDGGDNQSIGLERAGLLGDLVDAARDVDVDIAWGSTATLDDVRDADLVVAADGAGSTIRTALADQFQVDVTTGDLAFIWCGADITLSAMTFEIVETAHGTYVAHVMPYAPRRCTFQVDTSPETLTAAGLDPRATAADGTDHATLEHLSDVFADLLDGTSLRGNRSVWSTFDTIRCGRWSHDQVVLVGDAAHTAHYSVGSGTRMAMEDALALVDALDASPDDLPAAFDAYERRRRPSTERLQDRALRSQRWWRDVPGRLHLPASTLMVNYQTRTGALGADALGQADPALVQAASTQLGLDGAPIDSPFDAPLRIGSVHLPRRLLDVSDQDLVRVVPAEQAAASPASSSNDGAPLLAELGTPDPAAADRAIAAGADGVVIDGLGSRGLLDRLEAAERVRLQSSAPVAIRATRADLDLLEAAILAGRVDLVLLSEVTA